MEGGGVTDEKGGSRKRGGQDSVILGNVKYKIRNM